jgi:hypothetical protein
LVGAGVAVWYQARTEARLDGGIAATDTAPSVSEPLKLQIDDPLQSLTESPDASNIQDSSVHDNVRLASVDSVEVPPLELSTDRPVRSALLQLKAGQTVRGTDGGRPLIFVPEGGLRVDVENVRFERVDFVWYDAPHSEALDASDGPSPVIIAAAARRVEFRGCSFQSRANTGVPVVAVRWSGASARGTEEFAGVPADGGELTLADCVFDRVDAAIEWVGHGVATIDAANVLHLGPGPLLRLTGCPEGAESINMSLQHVTLRGPGAAIECRYTDLVDPAGALVISATDSALAIDRDGSLLVFEGPQRPTALLRSLQWSGQGSLVAPGVTVAVWRGPNAVVESLGDEEIDMAGLVRSRVQFVGPTEGGPAASRVTRWQVPLRSPDPPGAFADDLYLANPEESRRPENE